MATIPRVKNPNLKAANEEVEFTSAQLQELVKCSQDPVYFIKHYVKIQHPKLGIIPFDLYPYQIKMINGFHSSRFSVTLAARQVGKPLSIKEIIPTPSGYSTMENLQVGDYVLNAEGQPTRITAVSPIQHEKVCYKVHFSTGECIDADADHLWEVEYVENVKNKKLILTTQEIVNRGVLRSNKRGYMEGKFNIKVTKPLQLPDQEFEIDPYILGVWLGDGTSRRPEITNHTKDIEIIENVKQHYDISSMYRSKISTDTIMYTFKDLKPSLKRLNLLQNKHIPLKYLRSSFNQRLSLLQGLMDTDGYISPKNGVCELTLTNKELCKDIKELICTLGLKPTLIERNIKGKIPHTRWTITFTPYLTQCNVFRLKRKACLVNSTSYFRRNKSTLKRTIIKIESIESIPVKCIVVDNPDHLFLVGRSMIPTHNSVCAGAYLLWYACFNFDKTILIASNKNSNAMEMIHRIRLSYENLPMWLKPGIKEDGWNKHNIGFDNGTRIISEATSERSGRGFAISLLYLDEFAHVSQNIQEEFWTSIEPTLTTGGGCIMTSTPNGDLDIFAQIWRGAQVGANGFLPIEVKWNEPPGRDEKFKEETISRMGELKWKQEYECDFLSSDALLISSIFLANLTPSIDKKKPIAVIKDVVFWYDVKSGGTYLVGVDPSQGTGRDFTVITIYEFPMLRQIAEFRSSSMSPTDMYGVLKNVLFYLENKGTTVYFSIENNGVGSGMIAAFESDENGPVNSEFVSEDGKGRLGMITTSKSKMKACINLKEMMEKGHLHITSPILLKELKSFARSRSAYDHQPGSTSDCISATLIVIRIIEQISSFDQHAFDKLHSQIDGDPWSDSDIQKYDENNNDDAPVPIIM